MPRRTLDEPIPADELLFRSVSPEDVVGGDVMATAVDLPRCSFNRAKYCSGPASVVIEERPSDTGVVSISVGALPGPVPRSGVSTGEPYEFIGADDPNPDEDPENSAHAEVRLRPQGSAFSKNHRVKDKAVLAKAKDELCRRLTIVVVPI